MKTVKKRKVTILFAEPDRPLGSRDDKTIKHMRNKIFWAGQNELAKLAPDVYDFEQAVLRIMAGAMGKYDRGLDYNG